MKRFLLAFLLTSTALACGSTSDGEGETGAADQELKQRSTDTMTMFPHQRVDADPAESRVGLSIAIEGLHGAAEQLFVAHQRSGLLPDRNLAPGVTRFATPLFAAEN